MRYWFFQNNQVAGPFSKEELAHTAGFSAESLVCPEGRKGTQMGDWQRAGVVAELAESLLKLSRVATGVGGAPDDRVGFLPPEPTLRDLAALGSLQEKVGLLENYLSQLQDDLRNRDQEVSSLKTDLDLRFQENSALKTAVDSLESRLSAAEAMKQELEKARQEERSLAKSQEGFSRSLSELKERVEEVSKAKSEAPIQGPSPAPLASAPAGPEAFALPAMEPLPSVYPPEGEPPPAQGGEWAPPMGEAPALEAPAPMPGQEQAPPDFSPAAPLMDPAGGGVEPSPFAVPMEQPPFGAPAESAPFGGLPEPAPYGGDMFPQDIPNTAAVAAPSLDLPTPLETLSPGLKDLSKTSGAASSGKEGVSDLAPGAEKKKGKGKIIALAVLGAAALGGGAAFHLGYLDPFLGKKTPAPAPVSLPATPAPEPAPPPVDAQKGLPDRTQEAMALAKGTMLSGGKETLSERLEGKNPAPGLSPWTVERVEGDLYRVSFYDRSSGSKTPRYRYDVELGMGTVRGSDAGSQAVLEAPAAPASQAPPRPEKKRKAKARKSYPDKETLMQDPLGSMLMESALTEPAEEAPAPKKKSRKNAGAAPKPAEEEAKPVEDEQPPEEVTPPKPAKKRAKAAVKPKVSDEEEMMRELMGEDAPAPAKPAGRTPARAEPKESAEPPADEESAQGEEEAQAPPEEEAEVEEAPKKAPARSSMKKAKAPSSAPKKSKEELTLDELLLPGAPK